MVIKIVKPGLYWLTIFGAELVRAFSQTKLDALSDVEVLHLQAGQMALKLKEPVTPENMEQRLRQERQLADALGSKYFFDRHQPNLELEPVPELLATLT